MAFLIAFGIIMLFVIFGICFSNWINKPLKDGEEEQKNLLDELFAKHNEDYEKWEKSYLDFYRNVGQCYNFNTEERKNCLYPNTGKMYNVTTFVPWNDRISREEAYKYGVTFVGFYHPGEVAYNKEEIVTFTIYELFLRENDSHDMLYTVENKDNNHYISTKVAIILKVLYDKDGNLKLYEPNKYKISDIKYFKEIGAIETLTNISGGGGGGSDIKGAIVGGLIAGDAGAIIGSRKEIAPVTTTHETKDNRITYIFFNDGRKLNISGIRLYEWLMELIPEKEYNYYIQHINQATENVTNNNNDQLFPSIQEKQIEQNSKCSNCGNLLKSGDAFCSKCGSVVKHDKTFCNKCGNELKTDDAFCSKCGNKINI